MIISSLVWKSCDSPTITLIMFFVVSLVQSLHLLQQVRTIKKIDVLPMELRRPSILRASGHTFEYLGYGSGNCSTSHNKKQDRSSNRPMKQLGTEERT